MEGRQKRIRTREEATTDKDLEESEDPPNGGRKWTRGVGKRTSVELATELQAGSHGAPLQDNFKGLIKARAGLGIGEEHNPPRGREAQIEPERRSEAPPGTVGAVHPRRTYDASSPAPS